MLTSQYHFDGPPFELMGPLLGSLKPTAFLKPMGPLMDPLKSMGPGVIFPPAPLSAALCVFLEWLKSLNFGGPN